VDDPRLDDSVVMVHIFVEDKNDNLPQFEAEEFNIGIPFNAKLGDLILDATARDPDVLSEAEESYANKISYRYVSICSKRSRNNSFCSHATSQCINSERLRDLQMKVA
jgi:hypothetical protein